RWPPSVDDNSRPLGRQRLGDGLTDPAAAPRHHCPLAAELKVHSPFSFKIVALAFETSQCRHKRPPKMAGRAFFWTRAYALLSVGADLRYQSGPGPLWRISVINRNRALWRILVINRNQAALGTL